MREVDRKRVDREWVKFEKACVVLHRNYGKTYRFDEAAKELLKMAASCKTDEADRWFKSRSFIIVLQVDV